MRVEALDQKEANNENTRSLHVGKICFKISPCSGNRHDPPEGRKHIESLGFKAERHLLMDRTYEDDKTRALVLKQGLIFVVLPKKNRKTPWSYDTVFYERRNEIECFRGFLLATISWILSTLLSLRWL